MLNRKYFGLIFVLLFAGCTSVQTDIFNSRTVQSRIIERDLLNPEVLQPNASQAKPSRTAYANLSGENESLAPYSTVSNQKIHPVESVEVAAPLLTWTITDRDQNLRVLLTRWAAESNPKWELIWQADFDIPIAGKDAWNFADFKSAVRFAAAITDQSDKQIKPCFHSNQVVRIVRRTTACKSTT